MGTFIFTLVALCSAAILTIIDHYFDGFKKSRFTLIRNLPVILIFLALIFSIFSEFLRYEEEDKANKLRNNQYNSTFQFLNGIESKSKNSIKKLEELKISANVLNDSLAKNILVQNEINKASKELLSKNREMYLKSIEEAILKRKNYEKEIQNVVVGIQRMYNEVEFKLNSGLMDSVVRLQRFAEINFQISTLLNSTKFNNLITDNPIVSKYWNTLDSVVERLNWPLNGYSTLPIQDVKDKLAFAMRQFCTALSEYYMLNNNSYYYPPKDMSILKVFDNF